MIVVEGTLTERIWKDLVAALKKGKIGHQSDIVAFLEKEGKDVIFDNYEGGDEARYLNAAWQFC